MNKKYFDTKPNTVEQSVLGVWRNAVDEAESRKLDGRTKGYKEHRTKLEAQRARLKKEDVEEVELDEGYLELEFKDKQTAEKAYNYINNKIWAGGNPPYDDFNQEGNSLQIDTDANLNRRNQLLKDLKALPKNWKFKVVANEEVEIEEALKPKDKKVIDAFYDKKELEGKLLSTDGDKLEKLGMGSYPYRGRWPQVAIWKGNKIEITSSNAVRSDDVILRYMKKSIPKLNFDPKSYKKYFGEESVDEATPDYVEIDKSNVIQEAQSGDKEAYQKFFNSVLKKFKVKSPAELDDAKKKEFFNYVDKNWKGSDEKAEEFIRNIKKESTNKTLKQMWEEGLDARTREYKNHRTKLETKRLRHEKVQSEQEKDDKAKKGVNIKVDPVIKDTRKY